MFLNNIVILSIQIKIKFKIPKNLNSKKDQRLNIFKYRYGIAPKLSQAQGGKDQTRIEVLNPCDDGDDQKTPTVILFSNEG